MRVYEGSISLAQANSSPKYPALKVDTLSLLISCVNNTYNISQMKSEQKEASTCNQTSETASEDKNLVYRLDEYVLLQTIGDGLNCKVKIAYSMADEKYYAIKMIKENDNMTKNLRVIINENSVLQQLNHPNIVKSYKMKEAGTLWRVHPDKLVQTQTSVAYSVQQLALYGTLLDYICRADRFDSRLARFYFGQLLDGLEYMHSQGWVHRDIKPDNLLIDHQFNLKIADLGFSTSFRDKPERRLKSVLGTPSFMAPEILCKQPYDGEKVDIFAAGVVLFMLMTGTHPFNSTAPNDSYYRLIREGNFERFWGFHTRKRSGFPQANYPPQVVHLINWMIGSDPATRPSLSDVRNHEWMQGEVMDYSEVVQNMTPKRAIINKAIKLDEIEAEAQQMIAVAKNHDVSLRDLFNPPTHRLGKKSAERSTKLTYLGRKRMSI